MRSFAESFASVSGSVEMFSASSEVSRAEWRRFASAVDFERRYAGIRAFGFVKRVVDRDAAGLTDPDGRPVAIWHCWNAC